MYARRCGWRSPGGWTSPAASSATDRRTRSSFGSFSGRSGSMATSAEAAPRPGYFGEFGGQFVPEVVMPALAELADAYEKARSDPDFQRELAELGRSFVG